MVHALTQAIGHLGINFHGHDYWRSIRFHGLVRPLGRVLQLWRDARVLSLETGITLYQHRILALAGLTAVILSCVWVLSPHDLDLLAVLQESKKAGKYDPVSMAARALSHWGDFLGFNLAILFCIYSFSLLLRSRFLRLVVVISLLGATFTGGTANICRFMLGRARPSAKEAPGFYGPSLSSRLHSCPSGHTATAFGGTIPIAVALPPVGVPLMITAGCIAWSRMHNNAHHPTDILISTALAAIYGIPLGIIARRMRRNRSLRLQKYAALSARRRSRPQVPDATPLPEPSSYALRSDP